LRVAELVTERRDGTRRLYRADHDLMERLRRFLDEYRTDSLQQLRAPAEAADERKKGPWASVEVLRHTGAPIVCPMMNDWAAKAQGPAVPTEIQVERAMGRRVSASSDLSR
jgi:hypothetical protein